MEFSKTLGYIGGVGKVLEVKLSENYLPMLLLNPQRQSEVYCPSCNSPQLTTLREAANTLLTAGTKARQQGDQVLKIMCKVQLGIASLLYPSQNTSNAGKYASKDSINLYLYLTYAPPSLLLLDIFCRSW